MQEKNKVSLEQLEAKIGEGQLLFGVLRASNFKVRAYYRKWLEELKTELQLVKEQVNGEEASKEEKVET